MMRAIGQRDMGVQEVMHYDTNNVDACTHCAYLIFCIVKLAFLKRLQKFPSLILYNITCDYYLLNLNVLKFSLQFFRNTPHYRYGNIRIAAQRRLFKTARRPIRM